MTAQFVLATVIRWVGLCALATLVGGLVLEVLVLPGAAPELDGARRRLRRLAMISLVVLVFTSTGELVTRAQTMVGGSLGAVIRAIPTVLTQTHFGTIWIARLAVLALALLVSAGASPAARVASLALGLSITATTALTGHAADWGDVTPSAFIDWVHVVAVSAWAGGLLALTLGAFGEASRWPRPLFVAVARRFSTLAGRCLAAALLSGGYNSWVQLPRPSALWTTAYGRALGVKLLLVLGLIWLGAVNRYTLLPALGRDHRPGLGARCFRLARLAIRGPRRATPLASVPSRLGAMIGREAMLAVLVFGCTAVLVDSTPARHADHTEHQPIAEPGPFRVTMEELHEKGGVPAGWMFVPPAGDPVHGREVFVRLGCYTCHRARGEQFPMAGDLGPDLTGVGTHHPAGYLLESILNPNAVIVEGGGYTGPDGKSIMPDYRGQLTVGDLIDLVAYLKAL